MEAVMYGKSWFLAKRRFTETWDDSKARAAHVSRKPYTAAISDQHSVVAIIDVNNDYLGVDFLDELGRDFLSYQFQELEPGRLFLTMATHREFAEKTDAVKSGTTYYFKPDGRVTIEKEDFTIPQLSESEKQVDVTGNWEAYPTFGDYGSITRVDR